MRELILLLAIAIVMFGCNTTSQDMPSARDQYLKHYPWLIDYHKTNSAADFYVDAKIRGFKTIMIPLEGGGKAVWVFTHMINAGHIVDPMNKIIVRCDSTRPDWIDYHLRRRGIGKLDRNKYEVKK